MFKTLKYIIPIILLTAALPFLVANCGGSGVSNLSPSINPTSVPEIIVTPTPAIASLKIEIVWPVKENKPIDGKIIHPTLNRVDINITWSGGSKTESIIYPNTSANISGIPADHIVYEFIGKNNSGAVISYRRGEKDLNPGLNSVSTIELGVSIIAGGFYPQTIPLSKGDTLYWVNNDTVTHTVTADDSSFNSGDIAPGGDYYRTFNEEGLIAYHCNKTGITGYINLPIATPTPTLTPTAISTSTPTATSTSTPTATSTPTFTPTVALPIIYH
jgi:plastocyanin